LAWARAEGTPTAPAASPANPSFITDRLSMRSSSRFFDVCARLIVHCSRCAFHEAIEPRPLQN
jgi:hypothetical protein